MSALDRFRAKLRYGSHGVAWTRDEKPLAYAEAPYVRGVAWEVFYCGSETEHHDIYNIEKIDVIEIDELDLEDGSDNPWFEYDEDAELLVLFLALDGDKEAQAALREIGCTFKNGRWV